MAGSVSRKTQGGVSHVSYSVLPRLAILLGMLTPSGALTPWVPTPPVLLEPSGAQSCSDGVLPGSQSCFAPLISQLACPGLNFLI